jgi:hypothetical protein
MECTPPPVAGLRAAVAINTHWSVSCTAVVYRISKKKA